MAIYSVLEPPPRRRESRRGPDDFVFVRDGLHFWAFVFAPLWMLLHRLWLVFIAFVLAVAALQAALHALSAGGGARFTAYALMALLVGLEAGTLRRWTLVRRGWREAGIVSGDSYEGAERRFFDAWAGPSAETGARPQESFLAPARATFAARHSNRPSDIVGLFPEPGARR